MARHRPARPVRARAVLVTVVAAAGLAAGMVRAPAAAGTDDPRARRTALLLQAAELTDRLEASEADVVAAQLRRSRTAGDLAALRSRMRARAVIAYMRGTGASVAALAAPRVYAELVATKEKELVTGYKAALAGVDVDQQRAEQARRGLRAAQDELVTVQSELDTVIAADDARRADELRRADEARRAALARQAAALAAARGQARLAVGSPASASAGGYAPTPLDPAALLPRHRAATDRQIALMRRVTFGPLPPGAALPAGLARTGQRVEGNASWYGPGFNGRPTASGAIYDQEAWTVASRELPLGTLLAVSRGDRRVLLLVNDRGPYVDGRVLDLSAAAARALGVGGVAPVSAEVVTARAL